MLRRSSWTSGAAAAFALVATVHLGALLVDAEALADVSQWLLVPPLLAAVLSATTPPRTHPVRWTVAALAASWLGDVLPALVSGDGAFLVMVGCFLVAQIAYVVAFAPQARHSVLHRRPVLVLPYALVLVVLLAACAPHAGSLLVPVAVYGGVLAAMAVLATGLGRLVAAGGAVFLVSDALIALERFVPTWELARGKLWVMLSYALAQALIVGGLVARDRALRSAPARTTGASGPPSRPRTAA